MLNQNRGQLRHNNRRRYNTRKLNLFVWNETFDICSNTCFGAFLELHWIYFCQPAKLSFRFWYSPITEPELIIKWYFVSLIWKLSIHDYAREVWDYGKTQTDLTDSAIDQFDWVNLFLDKNINELVILLSSITLFQTK